MIRLNRRIESIFPIIRKNSNIPANRQRIVKIVEVGPRDGLQNESSTFLSSGQKVTFIQKLVEAGCKFIECGSFVSPKWIPAMANSKDVLRGLNQWRKESKNDNVRNSVFSVLTPNLRGFQDAIDAGGVDEVAIFGAASETFSQKNIGCSIEESLARFQQVIYAAKEQNIPIRGYISCTLGCPYEKNVDPSKVAEVADKFMEMGCHEVSLGDTIGKGTPLATIRMITDVKVRAVTSTTHYHIQCIS
jgi:hydroxymethylglutaryl-CoA lyase